MRNSVVLIGMPGCGKSTLGVLLAKRLAMGFVDTDLIIQAQAGMRLQEFQQLHGMDAFRELECRVLSSVDCAHTVVATGGSAIYYPEAMSHLKEVGRVIYLNVPLAEIQRRIGALSVRGVVMDAGATLGDLYEERSPLYREYADDVIACEMKPLDVILNEVVRLLRS